MGKKAKKSHLSEIPAWGLSLMALIISGVFLGILHDETSFRAPLFGIIVSISFDIFIVVACFIICRTHPKSVWYTPIICNALIISSAIFELIITTSFWIWILLGIGFVLSVIGAIVGARIGRRRIKQAK